MEFIKDLIVSIVMVAIPLLLFVGVPLFIFVARRRELARMTPDQRVVHRAEERQWLDEEIEETSNPCSLRYAGIRHDDDR